MELNSRRFVTGLWAALILGALAVPTAATPARAPRGASAAPDRAVEARLNQLFADDARRQERLDPLSSLYRGKAVSPEVLAMIFTDVLDRRQYDSARQSLRALTRIDRRRLSPERRISYDVFRQTKQEQAEWLQPEVRALTSVRPLNHFGGLHAEFPTLLASDGAVPYATESDYRRALALDAAFPQVLDNAIAKFRQGMASGVLESKMTVRNMVSQIDSLLAGPLEQSQFYSPVRRFPVTVPRASQKQLRAAWASTIRDRINPSYRRLRDFLVNDYMPVARDGDGLSAMKGGPGLYRRLIERETTVKLDPDEIHRLGITEVARIQGEMDGVRQEMGFGGTLRDFFETIRTDPQFHPKTQQELALGFTAVGKSVDKQIPRFFSRVPKTKLIIEPYPAYRQKFEAGGSYTQGSPDGSRPGVFYYNIYDLPSRFLTGITTLYMHEGSPGHHFQISLAQEDLSLPGFQRFDGNNAFSEGWALYAETLGYEMGFYKDPKQHWGTLDDEMLRAMRLVVDTGIHAKGWNRDQAIAYMLANSGMGRTDATSEVERYIANPAQALSYKIGALTIQRLRRKAETELGAKFDIREFHAQVLGSGALPLPVLESKIDGWIAANR